MPHLPKGGKKKARKTQLAKQYIETIKRLGATPTPNSANNICSGLP